MYNQNKLNCLILLTCLIVSCLPILASNNLRYTSLDLLSGLDPSLDLQMHEKSYNLDLSRTQNIRVRLKVDKLYKNNSSINSFKVSLYEIVNSERNFISTQNLTIKKGSVRSRILSLEAGYFSSPNKNIEIDVFNTVSNLVNTYEVQISAYNLDSQILATDNSVHNSAECDSLIFDECHLDYLFQKVTFEAKPQSQISTRVVKGEDGLYKVTIPVPKSKRSSRFNFIGRNHRAYSFNREKNPEDTLNSDFMQFLNESVSVDKLGHLGLGVQKPNAWLHLKAGNTNSPAFILEKGPLSFLPRDGALEFDGDKLYFTKNGKREELGLRGPPGPVGPRGPEGKASVFKDSKTANLTVSNELDARLFNGQIFKGGIFNGSFFGDGSNLKNIITHNGTVNNLLINNGLLLNTSLDGKTSINGNLIVKGVFTADQFQGDFTVDGDLETKEMFVYDEEIANIGGASIAIDWNLGNRQYLEISANISNLSFINPRANKPGNFDLVLINKASYTVSGWDRDIKWAEGSLPMITKGAGSIDLISCLYRYYGGNHEYLCFSRHNFK